MDREIEASFLELKRQLRELQYSEPLGIESAPLVSRLVADLILTTENYELLREKYEDVERKYLSICEELEPLRKNNANLVNQNNEVCQVLCHLISYTLLLVHRR